MSSANSGYFVSASTSDDIFFQGMHLNMLLAKWGFRPPCGKFRKHFVESILTYHCIGIDYALVPKLYITDPGMIAVHGSILQWCHNECNGVSNHQPHDCLLNRLFRCRSRKTSKLRATGLCAGPAQRAGNTENVSIWWVSWRHDICISRLGTKRPVQNGCHFANGNG